MIKSPFKLGVIHFIGIGGIGMSGIAEVLHNLGHKVQGSDISLSANVRRLRALGIKVHIGHEQDNLKLENGDSVSYVVYSSAVKSDNPEIIGSHQNRIPVIRRAEMLAELMRMQSSVAIAGTHGKTTTTSLVGHLLEAGDFDPTVINGGIINAYGTNMRMGTSDWMVVEADESDGTFTMLPAVAAVITNIDPEHLDHYGSFDNLKKAFKQFVANLPFYGFVTACIDHEIVRELIPEFSRKVVSYGFSDDAMIRASDLDIKKDGIEFKIWVDGADNGQIFIPMFGNHNVLNSLAAIAVAINLGVDIDTIRNSLSGFKGVKRRFTKTGEVNGISIIDDYAHHPVEIEAVLKAGRDALNSSGKKLIAIMQPHRYTRLRDLFDEFAESFANADKVIIADVYEAGEKPIYGINKDTLVDAIIKSTGQEVIGLDSSDDLAELIYNHAESGDFVIFLGAGSISTWANELPAKLEEFFEFKKQANGS